MMAIDREKTLEALGARLEREADIEVPEQPLRFRLGEDGVLTIEGETRDVAEKRKVSRIAAGTPGVRRVQDRLTVKAPTQMSDIEIRGHLRDVFLQEPVFAESAVTIVTDGDREIAKGAAEGVRSLLEVTVRDGVVGLNGVVPSLSHMRLAGVLAWWVPGTRDVQNGLEVVPEQEDNDGELADAVRMALEKDRFVDATQLRVSCRGGLVTLEGAVATDAARGMAERDAWYVAGVRDVENRMEVVATVPD